MQDTQKTKKAPSKAVLYQIKLELQALHPQLKRLKVKQYYNRGKVIAHADLGTRRIHTKGSVSTILYKFTEQYEQRVVTAF